MLELLEGQKRLTVNQWKIFRLVSQKCQMT